MNDIPQQFDLSRVSRLEADIMDDTAREIRNEIDKSVIEEITWIAHMHNHPDWHLVEIPWEKTHDKNFNWNEACAWAVEQFGLPGENFVTHPSLNQMKFLFKHEQHAIMMTLRWI
jgi:hypothetical protein